MRDPFLVQEDEWECSGEGPLPSRAWVRLTVTLPPEAVDALERLAEAQGMRVTACLEGLVLRQLAPQGGTS